MSASGIRQFCSSSRMPGISFSTFLCQESPVIKPRPLLGNNSMLHQNLIIHELLTVQPLPPFSLQNGVCEFICMGVGGWPPCVLLFVTGPFYWSQLTVQTIITELRSSTILRAGLSRSHSVNHVDQFGTKSECNDLPNLEICIFPLKTLSKMQKKSLFCFVLFLQKLYKKACLKSQKYAHIDRHACSHTYVRIKEILSAIYLGRLGGKSWQEKIRSDQLKVLECYSNGMKWFLVHTKREGGQARNDKSRIPERKSHWSCRS